jgi:Dyp-type peroxidase family
MSKLNETDIQGFVLRGYNLPVARYLFLHLEAKKPSHPPEEPTPAQRFILELLGEVTTGQRWDAGKKPESTVNIAFTHKGLEALELPDATLLSFPVEFQQGMRARAAILGDTGRNAPEKWDAMWQEEGRVHVWLGVNAASAGALEARCGAMLGIAERTDGATLVGAQDAAALVVDGQVTTKEHFGFTDGFGNPDYLGFERKSQPGQGKHTKDGWVPLATGELLLGYADEAGELPVAPDPHLLAANGTFMVYRKLHQNVATFRRFLRENGERYGGGEEKLAAKLIGRWRDGTPVELSPEGMDQGIVDDPLRSTNFQFKDDLNGARCPIGAHVRRVNPRDAFGFDGKLIDRRRITRRGLPYGAADWGAGTDEGEHGVAFMVLNASIQRQFEFVQQQWIEYGNDAHLGNDKDMLMGNHGGHGRYIIQGDATAGNPPFVCSGLPNFVELRGGDYFFLPSITALGMIALGVVDPR